MAHDSISARPSKFAIEQALVNYKRMKYTSPWLLAKIASRLHIEEGEYSGFQHLDACLIQKTNNVAVFVVSDGQALVIEDPIDNFPSDALMGALRLIQNPVP